MVEDNFKKGERAALVSVGVSLLLAILKAIIGFWSGALVLVSDALDSAADIFTSLASFVGLRISQKKPTDKFPYGFYKAENFASLFISALIIYGALRIGIEGYNRLLQPAQISYLGVTLTASVISGIVAFFMSVYLRKKGKEINSESLLANSKDRLKDVFASAAIFLAILLAYSNVPYVEGVVTMVISVLIVRMGLLTARDSIFALMDVSPDVETEKNVKAVLDSITGVESYKELRLRKAGPYVFGQVDVNVRKYLDVSRAHDVADKIEERIKTEIPSIENFFVHVEPFEPKRQKIAVPIKTQAGLNSTIASHTSRASRFLFAEIQEREIEESYVKDNPYRKKEVRAGLSVSKFLMEEKIDALITKEIGEITLHTLRDNLISVFSTDYKRARYAIDAFIDKKLDRMEKPTRRKE